MNLSALLERVKDREQVLSWFTRSRLQITAIHFPAHPIIPGKLIYFPINET